MVRGEQPTKALTPDKLDRSMRAKPNRKPYPLTEEEATPDSPRTERAGKDASKVPRNVRTSSQDKSPRSRTKVKKGIKEKTSSDYNKLYLIRESANL